LLKALGAFIVVIVLLVVFLKILGLVTRGRRVGKGSKAFNLKGTMLIDSRRYLAAVEIDQHMIIVGVTPDRLSSLAQWSLADDQDQELAAYFKHDDAVAGPKALGPGERPLGDLGPGQEPLAFNRPPQARNRQRPRPPQARVQPRTEPGPSGRPLALEKGPGLGPGRGSGLGADPRSASEEGPVLDLSLDDQAFEGSETNDDFLKMLGDERETK
jgi:flagellar biogenesis protein FliO